MPSVRVSTGDWVRGRERQLVDAVHQGVLMGLKVPDWDRDTALHLIPEERRIIPTGCSERFTKIEVLLYTGRTTETKRAYYDATYESLAGLGISKQDVKIILIEMPPENWGIGGTFPLPA
ncbi:MAG: tautomerase family protein [Alphaproteobacteria bacterium]|nr:tautomerase family protein [Alphaproteobacteria bacterium]